MSKLSIELIKNYNQEHQYCECEKCEPNNIWDKTEEDYKIDDNYYESVFAPATTLFDKYVKHKLFKN